MTHHPHLHMIRCRAAASRSTAKSGWHAGRDSLPVRVLSRLFRRLVLRMLAHAHAAGRLAFFGDHAALANAAAFPAPLY